MSATNENISSQPSLNTSYNVGGNPASKEPAEQGAASNQGGQKDDATDQRIPSKQTTSFDQAEPSASGKGIRGAGPGENSDNLSAQEKGEGQEVHAEQMAAGGEDRIADSVKGSASRSGGGGGGEPNFSANLDDKKAEQAPKRQAMKEEQQKEVDVAGVLSQRGGPAEPSDSKNM